VLSNQREACGVAPRDRLDIEDVARRVADRFAVEGLRVVADGGLPRIRIVGIGPRQAHVSSSAAGA
jgi:hypothetical protein